MCCQRVAAVYIAIVATLKKKIQYPRLRKSVVNASRTSPTEHRSVTSLQQSVAVTEAGPEFLKLRIYVFVPGSGNGNPRAMLELVAKITVNYVIFVYITIRLFSPK